jgi:hypothetical protein
MARNEHWTLVQHSGFVVTAHEDFRNAVETRSITAAQAERVRAAGGLVFTDYFNATEAEEAENYPPGTLGLIPQVKGAFSVTLQIDGMPVYVPDVAVAL